jgi:hypothetical protein
MFLSVSFNAQQTQFLAKHTYTDMDKDKVRGGGRDEIKRGYAEVERMGEGRGEGRSNLSSSAWLSSARLRKILHYFDL